MRLTLMIAGILLIIFGGFSFYYQRFSFSTTEEVAELKFPQVAHFQVTEKKQKTIEIPPTVAGVSVIVGVVLLSLGIIRQNKK